MKRLIFLLLCAVGFCASTWAESFSPQEGKPYFIRNAANKKYVLHNTACVINENCILSAWDQYSERSLFVIAGDETNGYTIRLALDNKYYVYAVNTKDQDSNVGVKEVTDGGETSDAKLKWKIQKQGDNWNIIPFDGQNGWNVRGNDGHGNTTIGQWTNNANNDNQWQLLTPSDLVAEEKVAINNITSDQIGSPTTAGKNKLLESFGESSDCLTKTANLEGSVTAETMTAFKNALITAQEGKKEIYLPTGYYTMQNVDTSRDSWLYGDMLRTDNPGNLTLQSNTKKETNDGIWYVTNNGTTITIKNGQGSGITYGNSNSTTPVTPEQLNFGNYIAGKSGIYFTEALNCTSGTNCKLGETHFITNWVGGGANANDNRWVFTAVDDATSETNVYSVTITGAVAGAPRQYITRTSTNEVAGNGGFFISTTALQGSDFTAAELQHHTSEITVSGQVVTLTYTPNYSSLLTSAIDEVKQHYDKPGYLKESAISEAVSTAEGQKDNATETDYTTFTQAVATAYNTVSNIAVPEAGKVYTITCIMGDGAKRYLYINNDGVLRWQTTQPSTDGLRKDLFVVQHCGENYKISALCGEGNLSSGPTFTSDEGCLCYFGLKAGTQRGTLPLFLNQKDEGKPNEYRMLCIAGNTGQTLGYWSNTNLSGLTPPAATAVQSMDFAFEEVTDATPFTVNLAAGQNGNFGTLCLPYAAKLPTGVTAYKAVLANEGNTLVAVPMELTEDILPAGTPVILAADNAGEKTLEPAADQGEKIETALTGSISPKTITGTAYVLAKASTDANSEIGFFLYDNVNALPGNKAYYVPATGTAPQMFSLQLGESTGITSVRPSEEAARTPMYDLTGRRITAPARGTMYLQGGRKFIKQ